MVTPKFIVYRMGLSPKFKFHLPIQYFHWVSNRHFKLSMSKTKPLISLLPLNNFLPSVFPMSVTHAKNFGIILESSHIPHATCHQTLFCSISKIYPESDTTLEHLLPPLHSKALHLLSKLLKSLLTGVPAPQSTLNTAASDYLNMFCQSMSLSSKASNGFPCHLEEKLNFSLLPKKDIMMRHTPICPHDITSNLFFYLLASSYLGFLVIPYIQQEPPVLVL